MTVKITTKKYNYRGESGTVFKVKLDNDALANRVMTAMAKEGAECAMLQGSASFNACFPTKDFPAKDADKANLSLLLTTIAANI